MEQTVSRPALWTKDFILAFISNLLMFFSFYTLVPVLPFYVIANLGTTETVAGIVIALYTISALVIRPFSGYLVDKFSRKPLYLLCYGCFCAAFAGYAIAASLMLFILLRIFHGFGFGICTVSGSTVAVDIMPAERRGEGIGYYGMAASLAMATGPFTGLWLFGKHPFDTVFLLSFAVSLIGFICIIFIKPIKKPVRQNVQTAKTSLDRFILIRALPCVGLLFIQEIGYGAVSNFIGIYCEDIGLTGQAGIFFLILSIGIICARIFSAKSINNGQIVRVVYIGSALLIVSFTLFVFKSMSVPLLYLIALLTGAGYGHINPAFQSMFINLSHHNQRGTANATYFTFWDMGIGLGIAAGGFFIDKLNFQWLFALCSGLYILSTVYFGIVSAPYYREKRLTE
ncbi:MAG: MFS transporter [Rikenellaceae bacterium]|nr:MFS transporter [Rikenellaceae bacterium]